jgi:hypothetical protein
MNWAGLVARVGRREMLTGFDGTNAKDGAHLEVLVVERIMILRLIFLGEPSISVKFGVVLLSEEVLSCQKGF